MTEHRARNRGGMKELLKEEKGKGNRGYVSLVSRRRKIVVAMVGLLAVAWIGYMIFAHSFNPFHWGSVIAAKENWRTNNITFTLTEEKECCGDPFTPNNFAFVILCFGKAAKAHLCDAAVESLRENGRWEGPIFLFTDEASCFPKKFSYPTTMKPLPPHDQVKTAFLSKYNVTVLSFKTPPSEMARKSYKTQLFDFIPYENIMHMDADILITSDVRGFLRDLSQEKCQCVSLSLFEDRGTEGWRQPYHGAVFLVNKQYSIPCLEKWRENILSPFFLRDQGALEELSFDHCAMRKFPANKLLLPEPSDIERINAGGNHLLHLFPPPPFAHFTKGRMAAIPRPELTQFAKVLGLKEPWLEPKTNDECAYLH